MDKEQGAQTTAATGNDGCVFTVEVHAQTIDRAVEKLERFTKVIANLSKDDLRGTESLKISARYL